MVQNPAWIPINIFYLAATILLLPGIVGLYLQQLEKYGNWGLAALFLTGLAIIWFTCIQFYETFLSRVALSRKLKRQEVDRVAQGRVWTGEQAQARRLVDELGGLRQALAHARSAAGLPDHAPIIELPPPQHSLLGQLLGVEGLRAEASNAAYLPPQLADMVRALAPFVIYSSDKPLALMELTEVGF